MCHRLLCEKRQYSEIASLLQGVGRVMEHFTPYLDIPQVKQLADQVFCTYFFTLYQNSKPLFFNFS